MSIKILSSSFFDKRDVNSYAEGQPRFLIKLSFVFNQAM